MYDGNHLSHTPGRRRPMSSTQEPSVSFKDALLARLRESAGPVLLATAAFTTTTSDGDLTATPDPLGIQERIEQIREDLAPLAEHGPAGEGQDLASWLNGAWHNGGWRPGGGWRNGGGLFPGGGWRPPGGGLLPGGGWRNGGWQNLPWANGGWHNGGWFNGG